MAWRRGLRFPAALLFAAAAMSACGEYTRQRVLTTLFEGVPGPREKREARPFRRAPRHPAPPKPKAEPEVAEASMPVPQLEGGLGLRNWPEALRKLPKDAAGGVDWVQALEEKAITPKAGLDPEAKDGAVFPLDVELTPEAQPLFKVTFPHKAHTAWLVCANCHPGIFQMRRGADPITMPKIFAGEFCGRCHGKVAFAVPTGCPRCHPALAPPPPVMPSARITTSAERPAIEKAATWEEASKSLPKTAAGGVDWVKALGEGLIAPTASLDPKAPGLPPLDLSIELTPANQPTFRAVFPHLAHTQWLTCANCHPSIFEMKKGANPITMEKIFAGEFCGRCHGKVAFAVPTGCLRCHPALAGGK